MIDLSELSASRKTQDLYPCDFPIKVIGLNLAEFDAQVLTILLKHAPDVDENGVTARLSNGGKYRSLSARFTAQSRAQLDALYQELSAHEWVRWVV